VSDFGPHRELYRFAAERDGNTDMRTKHMVEYQEQIRSLPVPYYCYQMLYRRIVMAVVAGIDRRGSAAIALHVKRTPNPDSPVLNPPPNSGWRLLILILFRHTILDDLQRREPISACCYSTNRIWYVRNTSKQSNDGPSHVGSKVQDTIPLLSSSGFLRVIISCLPAVWKKVVLHLISAPP
jgi:hypothetical protein